jgi:hypothetical protein
MIYLKKHNYDYDANTIKKYTYNNKKGDMF